MESICRLCCSFHDSEKMENLFDEKNRQLLEQLKYFAYFTFRIDPNDGFSPYICIRCTGLLNAAYEFKMICESAEANFWALSQPEPTKQIDDSMLNSPVECDESMDSDRNYKLERLEVSIDENQTEDSNGIAGDDVHIKLKVEDSNRITDIKFQMYHCDVCDTETTSKKDLIDHMKTHTISQPLLRIERRRVYTKVDGTLCYVCKELFRRKSDLRRHMRIDHQLTLKVREWICETCGKEFKSQYALKYHISGTHVDIVEKNYSCELCDFKCRKARYLDSHMLKHTGEKPHRCNECGVSFGFYGSMMRHILAVHRDEKRHKCTICDRKFKTKFRLSEHFNTHSGRDPHECSYCPRTYRYKNSLSRHVKKFHPRDVVKSPESDETHYDTVNM